MYSVYMLCDGEISGHLEFANFDSADIYFNNLESCFSRTQDDTYQLELSVHMVNSLDTCIVREVTVWAA